MTSRQKTPQYIWRSASISECGLYRTVLERRWADGETLAWLGHNPSTADGLSDDPTIRKEVGFSLRAGYGALVKVNAMDLRATDPKTLLEESRDPMSASNLAAIAGACAGLDLVVATGSPHRRLRRHVLAAIDVARGVAKRTYVLELNADGMGKHPLYVRGACPMTEIKCGQLDLAA